MLWLGNLPVADTANFSTIKLNDKHEKVNLSFIADGKFVLFWK